ncbi:hypothetical protein E2C01_094376 [Portunus trituberculatus]|uniref:Uncharacterized protein n=1 Tax=Portunus trituberculatus TaxID=210409 RepID=A0A5B7K335_PORTR|nr:hypothetical protein [Portunus trituberculatus]
MTPRGTHCSSHTATLHTPPTHHYHHLAPHPPPLLPPQLHILTSLQAHHTHHPVMISANISDLTINTPIRRYMFRSHNTQSRACFLEAMEGLNVTQIIIKRKTKI